jgi:hypothetical protein
MIRYISNRYEPDGRPCMTDDKPMADRNLSMQEAFVSLVKYELGFSGYPTKVEKDTIIVRTSIFARYDIVQFKGPENEMEPLLKAVAYWADLHRNKKSMIDLKMSIHEKVFGFPSRPLDVAWFNPMISGMAIAKQICLFVIDQNNEKWVEWTAKTFGLLRDDKMFYLVIKLALTDDVWIPWVSENLESLNNISVGNMTEFVDLILSGDPDVQTPEGATAFLTAMWPCAVPPRAPEAS